MKSIDIESLQFLAHSNYIENEYEADSLLQASIAWNYLIDQKSLTVEVILNTHYLLMKNHLIEEYKGKFRKVDVYVGNRKCQPPYLVPGMINHWLEEANKDIDEEEIIKRHVAYEKIHPFLDGNGRTGRMFLNFQRLKLGLPIKIFKVEDREEYYQLFK